MKTIYFIAVFLIGSMAAIAQVQPARPAIVPNQYQNNATYQNNSMQSNPPHNIYAPSFPGNGQYIDPSGVNRGGNINSNNVTMPTVTTPVYNNGTSNNPLWNNDARIVQPGGLVMPGDTIGKRRPVGR